jgi:hypothetical protein
VSGWDLTHWAWATTAAFSALNFAMASHRELIRERVHPHATFGWLIAALGHVLLLRYVP